MAQTDTLPDLVLDAIAEQISDLLASVATEEKIRNVQIELAETFSVWMLGLDATSQPDEDINRLAKQIGQWHHQINYDGNAEAYARTIPLGPDPDNWSVEQLSESDIAAKIGAAIDWIDEHIEDDPLVRLLIVPAYYLHTFWIHYPESNRILVIDKPENYQSLKYEFLYDAKDFLRTLSHEKHADGVRAPIP